MCYTPPTGMHDRASSNRTTFQNQDSICSTLCNPRRHPEFSALSKNLAIILLNNGATTCDMKTSSVFARIKFLWLCEPVFWLRSRRARRALLASAKLYVYFGREQKYSYLLARKRHENSGWRLGLPIGLPPFSKSN